MQLSLLSLPKGHSSLATLRVALCLVARSARALSIVALAAVLVVGCGSEVAPELTPVPTRDVVIKPIEDVLSPTPALSSSNVPAPTGVASTPTPSRADSAASGSAAPDFSLASAGGNEVSLSGLLEDHRAVVLVFYRGYF